MQIRLVCVPLSIGCGEYSKQLKLGTKVGFSGPVKAQGGIGDMGAYGDTLGSMWTSGDIMGHKEGIWDT